MKRRFVALLAVPALALGFAFASPGTDEANAYYPGPYDLHGVACTITDMMYANAFDQGDVTTQEQIYEMSLAAGC